MGQIVFYEIFKPLVLPSYMTEYPYTQSNIELLLNEAKALNIPHDEILEHLKKTSTQREKDFWVSELINEIIRKKFNLKNSLSCRGVKKKD